MAALRGIGRRIPVVVLAATLLAGLPGLRDAVGADGDVGETKSYPRSVVSIDIPDVTLVGTDEGRIPLRSVLDAGKPVMVNFIFTTCPSICPIMSAVFATVREKLGKDRDRLRMVSISIDPENDTPAVLRGYAGRFDADAGWLFLTGSYPDIVAVQEAFGTWQRNKMDHAPYTFFRRSSESPWIRVEGILSAEELGKEAGELLR